MNYIDIILLGLIQGFTEFFPVSSSGHLIIGKILLGISSNDTLIDVVLHLGTVFSILFFWRKDLLIDSKNIINGRIELLIKLFIACIPVALIVYFFKDSIENYFFIQDSIPFYLIINYAIMSFFIFISKYFHDNNKNSISYNHAFLVGVIQCFALMPGISRSGITIVAGLLLGYTFRHSMKFSFYLAIPTILFGAIFKIADYKDAILNDIHFFYILLTGFICSFIFGCFILTFLDKVIKEHKYWFFSIYCLIVALFLLVYYYGY